MRMALAVLPLLFLAVLASAKSASASVNVTITWNISADGVLDDVDLYAFIPSNSSAQKVITLNFSEPVELLINGSQWKAHFRLKNVQNKSITGTFAVATDYMNRSRTDDPFARLTSETKNVRFSSEIKIGRASCRERV